MTDHHRFLLAQHRTHIEFLDRMIADYDRRIDEQVQPFFALIPLLDRVPGINEVTAKAIIAEIGVDMDQFPDQHHLASWAGMCPGNNESAGKRLSATTAQGNRWLRAAFGEAAWAASRTKHTYLSARYRRLAARRGRNRTIVAVGHQILTIVYFTSSIRSHTTNWAKTSTIGSGWTTSSIITRSGCSGSASAWRSPRCDLRRELYFDEAPLCVRVGFT